MLPRDSSIPERGVGDDLAEVRPDIPRQQFLEYVDLDVAEGSLRLVRDPVGERADDTPLEVHRERSISFGSRGDPCGGRKCLPLKMIPASRLVVRT